MSLRLVYSLFLIFVSSVALAQTGTISGKIIDAKSGEELIGASILVKGTGKGASSDINGFYKLTGLEPGTYNLICKYVSYKDKEVTGVVVTAGKTTTINVTLDEAIDELDVVEVIAAKITNTEAAVVEEIKEADQVVSGMGAQQIKKSSDRDASEVARRIPGVVVIDNRFVVVRGLTERYNAVLLNNALAPSAETDVKAFSFDLVPSQLIDKFMIYKSPSADLPGEFAGGAIKIYTQNFPAKNELSVGYSTSYRSGTTIQPFAQGKQSPSEKFGYDGGGRNLPEDFPDHLRTVSIFNPNYQNLMQGYAQSLPNNWGYDLKNALPDQRFNINLGKRFDLKNLTIGNVTSITYSNTRTAFLSNRLDYNTFDPIAKESDTVFFYLDSIFQTQSRVGFVHNWAFKFGKNTIEFKNLLNQSGLNESTLRKGTNYEEGQDRQEYSFRYNQRTIYTGQINGQHKIFNDKGNLDWTLGYSFAKRSDPDWKRVRYSRPYTTNDIYTAYLPFGANPFFLGRIYLNMKEDVRMGAFNYEQKLPLKITNAKETVKIKVGAYIERKDRTFNIRNIGYAPGSFMSFSNTQMLTLPINQLFDPANMNFVNGFRVDEDTKASDRYNAANYLNAYYALASLPLHKRINLVGGVRIEDNLQALYSNRSNTGYGTFPNDTVIVENKIISVLPSANLAFHLIPDTLLLRFGYGKTINRPEFRELSPMSFYDFVFNNINTGNDSLKTPSINNFDMRLEWYPRKSETVSAGVFYKKFNNPIELYFQPGVGSGGTRSFVPGNAPSAVSYGAEIEIRKNLTGLTTNKSILDNFTIVANVSYIKSEIKLTNSTQNTGLNKTRPMMGQSPYVANAGIYYQNDSIDLQVNLLYNIVGPKVVIVGIPGIPEVYEMPRHLLDLTITKGIGKYVSLRFSIQDIVNQQFILLQDANEDGKLDRKADQGMQFYRRGSYYTFGINVKL